MSKDEIPPPLCEELFRLEGYFSRLCLLLDIDSSIPGWRQDMPCFTERIRKMRLELDYLVLPIVTRLLNDKAKP